MERYSFEHFIKLRDDRLENIKRQKNSILSLLIKEDVEDKKKHTHETSYGEIIILVMLSTSGRRRFQKSCL